MSVTDRRSAIIHEQEANFDYCRRYNGATYDDYDAEMKTFLGTQRPFWADNADIIYIGADAAFYSIGMYLHTAGSYTGMQWQYWSGAAWSNFTPFHDSSASFSADGYMAWGALSGWASTTVDGQAGYWIRASVTAVTTAAQVYSLLRHVVLLPPVVFQSTRDGAARFYIDVNGALQLSDCAYKGPTALTVRCRQVALHMDDLNLLHLLDESECKVTVIDLAQTATPDPDLDSYFSAYGGYIVRCAEAVVAASKMEPDTYEIEFAIESVTEILA